MNQTKKCHRIVNRINLYVDAFQAFREELKDSNAAFILSHYHSDHYTGLPKDGMYKGPAKIHCTPVTAKLLIDVHGVSPEFVVSHEYGATWTHDGHDNEIKIDVTFYCANHCPGAAMIIVRVDPGNNEKRRVYVHTGDFRYHRKMKEYPLLVESVNKSEIESIYLDTTYGSPKHTFIPQEEAIDMIASQVEQLLLPQTPSTCDTLVLLSCYSVGKEKVLLESSRRANAKIYVNDKKRKLLECCNTHFVSDEKSTIMDSVTTDQSSSNLHVIPMGLAGKMFPFFVPNFENIASYVSQLGHRRYKNVVVFIPTGFASSKYNQGQSGHKEQCGKILVEIRLVPYSEHSSFDELLKFVTFCKPMHVIPTVFSDENDYTSLEKRFHHLTDHNRNMRAFFRKTVIVNDTLRKCCQTNLKRKKSDEYDNIVHSEKLEEDPSYQMKIQTLISMGFPESEATICLKANKGNVDQAIDDILSRRSISNGVVDLT